MAGNDDGGSEGEDDLPETHAEKDLIVNGLYSDAAEKLKSLEDIA